MNAKVAMFENAFAKHPHTVELATIIQAIRTGKYADQVASLRLLLTNDLDAYNAQKRLLPAFCMSGTANSRTEPLVHSDLLQVDLDKLNGSLEDVWRRVKSDPHVAVGFISPSGAGLKLAVRIDGTRHEESFVAAQAYFRATYSLEIDPAVRDRLRLCFVSHDPEIWTNENAVQLPVPEITRGAQEPADCPQAADPAVLVMPSGGVTITESARAIFSRVAPSHTMFCRGGALAEIVKTDGIDSLDLVKADSFRSRVERFGLVMAWRSDCDGRPILKPARMSKDQATALMATAEARDLLPPVATVLRCPVLVDLGNGAVAVLGKGYHDEQGGLLVVDGEAPPQVPTAEAVNSLKRLIEEFQFQTAGDHSRALAALITPALRIGGHLREPIPIDVAEADQSQSGKGYRHLLVCALYNEPSYFVTSKSGGVGSVDESFAAALIAGRPFICLDNFRGRMDSQHLEAFLTCPNLFPARIPHRGEVMVDPKRFLLQMSSNGLEATRDLVNRASICRIRKRPGFHYRDTIGELQHRQPYFLGCVFSVVAEWIANGKPRTSDTRHDFRPWCQTLDWIVQNIFGCAPLMDGHQSAQERASNPALSWIRAVALAVERENRLGSSFTASELVELCEVHGLDIHGNPKTEDDAKRQVGRLFRQVFKDSQIVTVDGLEVRRGRREYRKPSGDLDSTNEYTFTR